MGTDHIIVLAVFHFIVEAIHVVQLGEGPFYVFLVAAGHPVAHAHNLSHVSFIHGVAATHDHDLGPAGGNGCLQGLVQLPRVLQALHDGTGFLNVDGPVGIGDAVPGAVDHSRVGIGGHVSLPYDAVGDAAEGLGSAGVVVKVEHTIGKGCRTAEIIAARLSCLIHDAGEGTGHGGSDAAGIGHVPCCEACKFLGSFVVRIGIRFEPVDDRHFSIVRFVDAVILSLGIIADPFQLGHVDGVRVFRTGRHIRDLAGHLLGCITYRNGSCRRFPCARGIAAVVLPFQVVANGTFISGGNGAAAQSYAVIYGDIGVMTNENGIGGRGGQFLISIANNYIIGLFSSDHMLVANNRIAVGFVVYRVVGTDDFRIAYIGCRIPVAVQHVEFADGTAGSGQCIPYTKELGLLRIIGLVATADS